ncbi:MAG: transglutaminase-like domain-containing protein [Akkermansiaceae bacterium]
MNPYLQASEIADFKHPQVSAKAQELANSCNDPATPEAIAKACFEWVRDHVNHSGDIKSAGNANSASEVLKAGNAWCFGKSHLLVALLRANHIPAAFCYQRVRKDDLGGFTLHGLVSIELPHHGWYRVDPRGNKQGVNAQFTPPHEQLAWPTTSEGEIDFLEKFPEPQNVVCEWIPRNTSHQQALDTLPDLTTLPHQR